MVDAEFEINIGTPSNRIIGMINILEWGGFLAQDCDIHNKVFHDRSIKIDLSMKMLVK